MLPWLGMSRSFSTSGGAPEEEPERPADLPWEPPDWEPERGRLSLVGTPSELPDHLGSCGIARLDARWA